MCFECNAINTQASPKSQSFMPRRLTRHVVQASFVKLYTLAWGQSPSWITKFLLVPLVGHFPVSIFSLRDTGTDISSMGQDWSNTCYMAITHYVHQTWAWILSRQSYLLGRKTPCEIGKDFNKQKIIWGLQKVTGEEKIVVFIPTTLTVVINHVLK